MAETAELLRRYIEYAPRNPGPMAATIRGWITPDGTYACAVCAGRIMARGCSLPHGSEPVWNDDPPTERHCCCCG